MIGSLIGAPLANYYGRKKAMIINAFFAVVLGLVCASCRKINSIYIFLICRILMGINAGINSSIAPVYLIEIAPLELRGQFGTTWQLGVTGGSVIAQIFGLNYLLGTNDLWPILLLLSIVPASIQIILSFWTLESPVYLATQGDINAAIEAQVQLYGQADESKLIEIARNNESSKKANFRLFSDKFFVS